MIFSSCICTRLMECICATACIVKTGNHPVCVEGTCLLPPCGSQGWNSSRQAWQQVPLPTETSHQSLLRAFKAASCSSLATLNLSTPSNMSVVTVLLFPTFFMPRPRPGSHSANLSSPYPNPQNIQDARLAIAFLQIAAEKEPAAWGCCVSQAISLPCFPSSFYPLTSF